MEVSKNKIKEISKLQQKKYRDITNCFIAEGFKAVNELIEKNNLVIEIYALQEIKKKDVNLPIHIIDEDTMKKISSTDTPCEILAVAQKKTYDIEKFKLLKKIILLDSVSDPGNLGTIIRSAAAFGIDGIILYGDCVDMYSPKVIRSCCGNLFKIPIIKIKTITELQNFFPNHNKIATTLSISNNISLDECKEMQKRIMMFGSEANGLDKELIKIADKNIRLDMKNNVESLNLAVCASIIMYMT